MPRPAYRLPEGMRRELAEPFGPVLDTRLLERRLDALPPGTPVAAVGDVVSLTLKEFGHRPAFFVCDFQTQRGHDPDLEAALTDWGDRGVRVANPPAGIAPAAWDAVAKAWADWRVDGRSTRIVVDGEEDLLGIPAFVEAPEGAVVLYGMPGRGVVWVEVDAAFKGRVATMLERFEHVPA